MAFGIRRVVRQDNEVCVGRESLDCGEVIRVERNMVKWVSYIVPASDVKKRNILPLVSVYLQESMQVGKSGCNLSVALDLVRRNKAPS
jgi:hypothetical protein